MRLSVLDQSIAVAGRPQDLSIRNTVALAQHCEALGYERFWVSEHHNHPTIVGTAPEIVIAAIAATTKSIRIGSAGIMLPHYAPFKVAEVFRVLDALAPGRIDMGLGRAPGSDRLTSMALNPHPDDVHDQFPRQIQELQCWLSCSPLPDGHPFARVVAHPTGPTFPTMWVLGSSDYGAQLAAYLGMPYAFAGNSLDCRTAIVLGSKPSLASILNDSLSSVAMFQSLIVCVGSASEEPWLVWLIGV